MNVCGYVSIQVLRVYVHATKTELRDLYFIRLLDKSSKKPNDNEDIVLLSFSQGQLSQLRIAFLLNFVIKRNTWKNIF